MNNIIKQYEQLSGNKVEPNGANKYRVLDKTGKPQRGATLEQLQSWVNHKLSAQAPSTKDHKTSNIIKKVPKITFVVEKDLTRPVNWSIRGSLLDKVNAEAKQSNITSSKLINLILESYYK